VRGILTPTSKVGQHDKQVGVVYYTIPVEVFVAVALPAERKQHGKQVGVIRTAVAVNIPAQREARIQQVAFSAPRGGVVARPHNIAPIGGDDERPLKPRAGCEQAGISDVQVFHPASSRPAKGTPVSDADHYAPVG